MLYTLLKFYVSCHIWVRRLLGTGVTCYKDSYTFIKDNAESSKDDDDDYDFCLSRFPNGKIQILKKLPAICNFQFIGCSIYHDDVEYPISLQSFYVEHNILDKPIFEYLLQKDHGIQFEQFTVEIWDHHCKLIKLNPSYQSIVLEKDGYVFFPPTC